jgi:hypothetical protein
MCLVLRIDFFLISFRSGFTRIARKRNCRLAQSKAVAARALVQASNS